MNKGLYIHVPFCRSKCVYCDFYSLCGCTDRISGYTDAVIRNIRKAGYTYDSVYFGGGTPSLLEPQQIERVLKSAEIVSGSEITMEANPDSVTPERLAAYRAAGVNRISVGIQSFSEDALKMLGRRHDAGQAENALIWAKTAGFENISADLMIALPLSGGTDRIRRDTEKLAELKVQHISVYMLKVEEGTPLSRMTELTDRLDEDVAADEYEYAVGQLAALGYEQYEISNFAKKGYECRHNLKYWHCEEYYGIGPGAHSCIGNRRFYVPSDLDEFVYSDTQNETISDENARTPEERLMLALRLREYISFREYPRCRGTAEKMQRYGLAETDNEGFRLTVKGFLISNAVIAEFMEDQE